MSTRNLLILTGSLGSGKTTVARLLAEKLPNGAHVESDVFYKFFGHPVSPHLPQASVQNEAAIAAACQAAKSLCLNGYSVVLEGIFGPWFLRLISRELSGCELVIQYVVLRTSLEDALDRVRRRGDASMEHVVTTMHPQFENLGAWESHVLDTARLSSFDVADKLLTIFAGQAFCLESDQGARAHGA